MFEDIIGESKEEQKVELDPDVCPYCFSLDIEDTGGVFDSSSLYIQSMICNTCKREWYIHFNQNLDVVNIDY